MDLKQYKQNIKSPLRKATLVFLLRDNEILLAMKKRGFGAGRWNGTGGKPLHGETICETAIRETQEEIFVRPVDVEQVATLNFYFLEKPEWNQQVHTFFVHRWEGDPQESEEMSPCWFNKKELPFQDMWPDDIHWLPKVIAGKKIDADFLFGENDLILDFFVSELN